MMQEITAWRDNGGAIHKTKIDAAGADLVLAFQKAWNLLPHDADKGDPTIIARALMTSINARAFIGDAMEDYEDALRPDQPDVEAA